MQQRRGCLDVEGEGGGDRVDQTTNKSIEIKVSGGGQINVERR